MDMGFPRDHAIEALQQTGTLEQAAEWALTHPPRIAQVCPSMEKMQNLGISFPGNVAFGGKYLQF